ncbi:MAG: signal peptide peptidase SppA [Tepidisphaeraceae bacterium]|jgi:protease IV
MRLALSCCLLSLAAGCGNPSFLVTPVSNAYELQKVVVAPGSKSDKVAIVEVEGDLLDQRAGGLFQAGENPLSLFAQELDQIADDDSVKAVVLRVNSPGGSVTTSDTMYDVLLRFRAKTHKPVVAAAMEVDASGAYYVSCAADRIVVSPTSIVGSIGVIFESFNIETTLDRIGVEVNAIKSAPLKDMGSPYKHLTPQARQVMQDMVDEYYGRFKNVVATSRGIKDSAALDAVTDGRVFSGDRAVALGLADQTGRLDDAIDLARKLANVPAGEVIMYKRPYGYSGSIYAEMPMPTPKSNDMSLKLPMSDWLPSGFYYLWQP